MGQTLINDLYTDEDVWISFSGIEEKKMRRVWI